MPHTILQTTPPMGHNAKISELFLIYHILPRCCSFALKVSQSCTDCMSLHFRIDSAKMGSLGPEK